jgi:hypothetical protein
VSMYTQAKSSVSSDYSSKTCNQPRRHSDGNPTGVNGPKLNSPPT